MRPYLFRLRLWLYRLTGLHRHYYRWSEIKAHRYGGPIPKCLGCGRAAR